jgi:hypothetical protein
MAQYVVIVKTRRREMWQRVMLGVAWLASCGAVAALVWWVR